VTLPALLSFIFLSIALFAFSRLPLPLWTDELPCDLEKIGANLLRFNPVVPPFLLLTIPGTLREAACS
jgi:hypothetical protein